jgi:hypothetical protein
VKYKAKNIGRYKDILAVQSSYNNHIHYIRIDENGNESWVGHASCNKRMTQAQLNKEAERWDKLINHDWSKYTNGCN